MRNLEDYGTRRNLEDYGTRRNLEDYGTRRNLEDYGTRRNLEDYGTRRNLEADGIKTQSGRLRYTDAKHLGISRHIIRAIGEIWGMSKAACAMMPTFDLAIIRVQTDK